MNYNLGKLEKITNLNNHINDSNLDLKDLLKTVDIELEQLSLEPIEKILNKEGKTK